MAISRPVRPSFIVFGTPVAVNPRQKFDNASRRYTDEVTGYEALFSQENGAQVSVRYGLDHATPALLVPAAVMVDVSESKEYGASLLFQRNVVADDLDRINSALSVATK